MRITNNHWRQFRYRDEVPAKVLADQFDYQDEDTTDGYFEYKGYWYHLDMFMRCSGDWEGSHGDSAFSGVMIRLSQDCEEYQVATWIHRYGEE